MGCYFHGCKLVIEIKKVFKDLKISGISGFSFCAIEPIRKAGNDGKLSILLNLKLFYYSVFFETVDYVFCLKELL